jgi:hypothetical protein
MVPLATGDAVPPESDPLSETCAVAVPVDGAVSEVLVVFFATVEAMPAPHWLLDELL